MSESDKALRVRLRLRQLRRWLFRFMLATSVLWGMFSAAVVFAVRYDLLPDDDPPEAALRPLPMDETRDWPVVSASDWRRVITPDSALIVARVKAGAVHLSVDSTVAPGEQLERLELAWYPDRGSAAWIAHIVQPACDCPFDSAERWDYSRIVIDPLTGSPISRLLVAAITAGELEAQYGVQH